MPVRDDVLAALTDEWQTATEIMAKVGRWSRESVTLRLRELRKAGEIEADLFPYSTYSLAWSYRRKQSNVQR